MTTPVNKYAALNAAAAQHADAVDVSVEAKSGFTRVPARAGVALFRFKSYIETGIHTVQKGKGKGKKQPWANFEFELVHPGHMIGPDDNRFPDTISLSNLNISSNPKAKYFKLFKAMNYDGKFTNFTQMLGMGFLGSIVHNVVGDVTYVNMEADGNYTIGAPRFAADPMQPAVITQVDVPELQGEVQQFLFDAPGYDAAAIKMMWDDIEISGEKKDGTPRKNWIQEKIRSAENFQGSLTQQAVGGEAIVIAEVADTINDAVAAATIDVPTVTGDLVDAATVIDATVINEPNVVKPTADPLADQLANIPGM